MSRALTQLRLLLADINRGQQAMFEIRTGVRVRPDRPLFVPAAWTRAFDEDAVPES